jgi:nitroimidazol reductase NimA-like FMN-containing flavoprotein (pyridoxamine 5'-phosphate oxidase superfamily)
MTQSEDWNSLIALLADQQFGVLGSNRHGHAYASLVAFAAPPDGRCLYFATTRATRKYHNLVADEQVALLIDNRTNQPGDLYAAAALTAYGWAEEVPAAAHPEVVALYLAKHPLLKAFIRSPSTAMFRIAVANYHLVRQFQQVTEFRML